MSTITTRAGKGSPLTNNEVDANFTNLNTDKAELSGAAFTGNITFTDNSKAIFGAGSDLQIYHDGTNSYIDDVGTGNLLINADSLRLRDTTGSPYLLGNVGAEVRLYHAGSTKLATTSTGIDVTGDVNTSGLLKVGTNDTEYANNYIRFKPTGAAYIDHSTVGQAINFRLSNASSLDKTAMTLTSAGNVLVGKTASSFTTAGVELAQGGTAGKVQIQRSSSPLTLVNLTDDGAILNFYKGTTAVGSIGYNIGALTVDGGASRSGLYFGDGAILPRYNGGLVNGVNADLGTISQRFQDLYLSGNISAGTGAANANNYQIKVSAGTTGLSRFIAADTSDAGYIDYEHSSDSWIHRTAGAERMRIDSSGKVGIGTSSPSARLHLKDTTGSAVKLLQLETAWSSPSGNKSIEWTDATNTLGRISVDYTAPKASMRFGSLYNSGYQTGDVMTLTADGSVGIGVTNPSDYYANDLVVGAAAEGGITIASTATSNTNYLNFADSNSGTARYAGMIAYDHSSDSMAFRTTSVERMRIDSSGNLLVGKTTTGVSGAGTVIRAGGELFVTRAGDVMNLNRLTSDGDIAVFRKDGASVGSIQAVGGDLNIGTGDTALLFVDSIDAILPATTANPAAATRDNAIDLGRSATRFDDIYATNGTIQTSDRNEKQDIEALSDAEQRVAVACKGLLRKFRWKSSVAENGDEARTHFGIIAQDLQAAFEAEGLDAGDYAMFISTTWTDEETNEEKTRMGVRYSELLAFIIAAI